ncbi:probable cytochrome P450 313a1 isoform X2 [Cryptotermes secundus]|uniref:probable cytochrome P450 313a1 isoform X2 n=1 Tax=Cryptotermes secundus TaxID=105785 RepID=UPI001454E0D3|nr:probable cytochrome P450 313a1 isoform X2 [Cryptotermes secundus]
MLLHGPRTCRRAFNSQHKMLIITLNLFVAIFILIWAYFTIKTRHMARLAKKIPGPKQSPLWKKLLTSRQNSKSTGMFQNMVQISRKYESTFCFWKGYELFVFVQDVKHIAVSCQLHS